MGIKNEKLLVFPLVLLLLIASFNVAGAQTPISDTTLQQFINLLEELGVLKGRIIKLRTELGLEDKESKSFQFTRTLRQGATGEDVKVLQEFLKQFEDIYPEGLVTGYFGPLTEAAVQKFQKEHNIVNSGTPATTGYGQVGPQTRARLNELLASGAGTSGVTPPGLRIAPGLQEIATTTSDVATTISVEPATLATTTTPTVATAATTTATTDTTTTETPVTTTSAEGGTTVTVTTITTPITDTTTTNTTTATSTAETIPPTISNIQATSITETSAIITWTTDETSDSKVDYALISSFATATTTADSANVISHSINLTNLDSNKTHYYVVVSADADGNAATSSEKTFTTLLPPAQQCEGIVC